MFSSSFSQPAASGFGQPGSSTGFGFGQSQQQPQSFTQPAASGFGQPQQQGSLSTGFGFAQSQQQPQLGTSTGFGFGQSQQQSQPKVAASTGFGFGQPQQQTQIQMPTSTSFGFGQQQQPQQLVGNNAFGFGQQQQPQQQQQVTVDEPLITRIKNIHLAYTSLIDQYGNPASKADEGIKPVFPNDEKCEFDALVYERKNEASKTLKHKLSKRRQDMADYNNPDSTNCVPVRLLGINELVDRFHKQESDSQMVLTHVESLSQHLSRLREMYAKEVTRFQGLKTQQSRLYNRTLTVLRNVEVLRCYKISFSMKERMVKDRLDQLSQKLKSSQERLMQLSSLEQESASRSQDMSSTSLSLSLNHQSDSNSSLAHSGLDLEAICSAFDKQRTGLAVLTDILTRNIRDVQIIKREMSLD